MIRRIKRLFGIRNYDAERLTELVLESGSQTLILVSGTSCDRTSLTVPCYRIFGECRGRTFHDVGDLGGVTLLYVEQRNDMKGLV